MRLATHSDKLERWLGTATVEQISASMKDWYGPPIAVGNVPGAVFVCRGGDFRGRITAGQVAPLIDYYEQRLKRIFRNASRRQLTQLNTGFSSVSDLILEATQGGKSRKFHMHKVGVTHVVGASYSHWGYGSSPSAGAAASAAPGGDAPTSVTLGAYPFTNPAGTDTQHFVDASIMADLGPSQLLLYDRIFQVAKTMNSNPTESVTGVPTRYQSSTPGLADFAGGNFAFPEVFTVLAAGAHNWTVCKYRNELGTDAVSFPSTAGVSAAAAARIDLPVNSWFMPLAASDTGVKDLDQLQYDTSLIATGAINWVIGHPIVFMPVPLANAMQTIDGIMTAFNLVRIFNDAALATLDVMKSNTTATTWNGIFTTVAG